MGRIRGAALVLGLMFASCSPGASESVDPAEPATEPSVPAGDVAEPDQTDTTGPSVPFARDTVRLQGLLAWAPPNEDGFVTVVLAGQSNTRYVPWAASPADPTDAAIFESEVGVSQDEIAAVLFGTWEEASSSVVVAAIEVVPDIVVERLRADSPWADRLAVEAIEPAGYLVTFGGELDIGRRSLIRPIGQAGELAVVPGFLIWSPDSGVVGDVVSDATGSFDEAVATQLTSIAGWSSIFTVDAQSVDDRCASLGCPPSLVESLTQAGTLVSFTRQMLLSPDGDGTFTVVMEHDDEDSAEENARRLPLIWSSALQPFGRPYADDVELLSVRVDGRFVIVETRELTEGAAGALWLSPMFTFDD